MRDKMSSILLSLAAVAIGLMLAELAYRAHGGAAGTIDALSGFFIKAFWVVVGLTVAISGNTFALVGALIVAIGYFMWRRDVERLGIDEWVRRQLEGSR